MRNISNAAVFSVVAAIALILNITESVLILRKRKRWKPFDKLLLSLSFADQLVSILTIIYLTLWYSEVTIYGHKFSSKSFLFLLLTTEDFSLLHILAITFDRLFAIKQPIKHNVKMQGRLPALIIAGIWTCVITFVSAVLSIMIFQKNEYVPPLVKAYSVLLIVFGICYAFAYKYMFDSVLTKSAKARNQRKCPLREVLTLDECKNQRNMFKTCILVLLSYIICMYPISIEILARKELKDLSIPSQVLLLANSVLNPLVYFYKGYSDRRVTQRNEESTGKASSCTANKDN